MPSTSAQEWPMRRLGVLHAGQQAMPAALGQTDRSKDTCASALAGAPRGRLSRIQRGDHHRRAKRRHRGRSKAAKPAAPVPVRLPHRATAVGGGSLRRQNGNARPAGQNSESLKVCRPGQFAELPLPLPIHAERRNPHGGMRNGEGRLLRCGDSGDPADRAPDFPGITAQGCIQSSGA